MSWSRPHKAANERKGTQRAHSRCNCGWFDRLLTAAGWLDVCEFARSLASRCLSRGGEHDHLIKLIEVGHRQGAHCYKVFFYTQKGPAAACFLMRKYLNRVTRHLRHELNMRAPPQVEEKFVAGDEVGRSSRCLAGWLTFLISMTPNANKWTGRCLINFSAAYLAPNFDELRDGTRHQFLKAAPLPVVKRGKQFGVNKPCWNKFRWKVNNLSSCNNNLLWAKINLGDFSRAQPVNEILTWHVLEITTHINLMNACDSSNYIRFFHTSSSTRDASSAASL